MTKSGVNIGRNQAIVFAVVSAGAAALTVLLEHRLGTLSIGLGLVHISLGATYWGIRGSLGAALGTLLFFPVAQFIRHDPILLDYYAVIPMAFWIAVIAGRWRQTEFKLRREIRDQEALSEIGASLRDSPLASWSYDSALERLSNLLRADSIALFGLDTTTSAVTHLDVHSSSSRRSDGPASVIPDIPYASITRWPDGAIVPSAELQSIRQQFNSGKMQPTYAASSVLIMPLHWGKEPVGVIVAARVTPKWQTRDLDAARAAGLHFASRIASARLYQDALSLTDELKMANKTKDMVLANVSHELRTPITNILAFDYLLRKNKDGNLTPRQMAQLDAIKRSGERLKELVADMFDASSIVEGQFDLIRSPVDMAQLVKAVAETWKIRLDERKQVLSIEVPLDAVITSADTVRVNRVISSLISNASKFSQMGAPINIRLSKDDHYARVSVTDLGVGISPEDQRCLFSWGFRADTVAARSVPGTGLGMFIAKAIVDRHGGRLWVESEPGKGTRVFFELPLQEAHTEQRAA